MKRSLVFAVLIVSLTVFVLDAQADAVWKKCDSSIDGSVAGSYVCCGGAWRDGNTCSECKDGKDNDGNGCADYPVDGGCTDASDDSEKLGTCATKCVDTDPFNNPSAKGTCRGYLSTTNQDDTCAGSTLTSEYYCATDFSTSCNSEVQICPTGTVCSNGVCKNDCADGSDNDADNRIDYLPPSGYMHDDGCKTFEDATECYDEGQEVDSTIYKGGPASAQEQCCSKKIDSYTYQCISAKSCSYISSPSCIANNCVWCGGSGGFNADCSANTCGDGKDNDGDATTDCKDNACWTGGVLNSGTCDATRSECDGGTYCKDSSVCSSGDCPRACDGCPSAGNCAGTSSCPGNEVIINMQKGNIVEACVSKTDINANNAHWYKIKGALGQQVNITFRTNAGKGSLLIWNITTDCYKLFNQLDYIKGCVVVDYKAQGCRPAAAKLKALGSGETYIINKMPPGGVLAAVSNDCATPIQYKIEINPPIASYCAM